jgi:UDP-2,3-diacylglucosamine pyrophosphatase LpxH
VLYSLFGSVMLLRPVLFLRLTVALAHDDYRNQPLANLALTWPLAGLFSRRHRDNGSSERQEGRNAAHRRLSQALDQAPVIPFDDDSRLVFFSDLHRGDDGPADAFRHNKDLFLQALEHYHERGYTYVEVGDGDELWKNPGLNHVRRAHAPIYRALNRFRREGRLHLLIGNHQLVGTARTSRHQRHGLLGGEALLLEHRVTGQRILVTHGHQGDGLHARIQGATRLMVRHFWRHLQQRGMRTALPEPESHHLEGGWVRRAIAWSRNNQNRIEQRIKGWMGSRDNLAMICGHTHRPAFARAGEQPYFNCGSGVQPGYITGLEIADGAIRQIVWSDRPKEGPGAQSLPTGRAFRRVTQGPRPVGDLA